MRIGVGWLAVIAFLLVAILVGEYAIDQDIMQVLAQLSPK